MTTYRGTLEIELTDDETPGMDTASQVASRVARQLEESNAEVRRAKISVLEHADE